MRRDQVPDRLNVLADAGIRCKRPLQPGRMPGQFFQPDCDLDHQPLGERHPRGVIVDIRHLAASGSCLRTHTPGHAPPPASGSDEADRARAGRWNVRTGRSFRRREGRRTTRPFILRLSGPSRLVGNVRC